jgi:predicted DNA-binding transcriptional regulator YafY
VNSLCASARHLGWPGPKVELLPGVMDAIIEALRGPFRLRIVYDKPDAPARIVEPHGVLMGPRPYLVARQPSRSPKLLQFRIDRIRAAACLEESFALEPGFSIERYAARAFGAHQTEGQYGEVIWKFAPEAAERAAG